MAGSAATTVDDYLAGLPSERRVVVATLRDLINVHLPPGYREGMAYGMIGWCIPLERYPKTYNGQPLSCAALAAQKNACSLYLTGIYMDPAREQALRAAAEAQGRKLDMGKSCVRFKRLEDLPLDAIAALVAGLSVDDYIALYEATRRG